MKGNRAAARYAKSLVQLSQEKDQLDAVNNDMQAIATTISDNKELAIVLKSPIVKSEKKHAILSRVFGNGASDITANFLKVLTTKNREELLSDIAIDFLRQYNELKGIVVAEVTTAVALDKSGTEKVMTLVNKYTEGKQVQLVEKIDTSIIGGFVIRIDDKMIDSSVQKKLKDLKKELLGDGSYALN